METGGGGRETENDRDREIYTLFIWVPVATSANAHLFPLSLPLDTCHFPEDSSVMLTRVSIILVTGPNQASDHQCPQFNK